MQIKILDRALHEISVQRDDLIAEISYVISGYWDKFVNKNIFINQQRKIGMTSEQPAHIAPVLELKKSCSRKPPSGAPENYYISKYYINWKLFDDSSYRRFNRHASRHISVSKPENIINVVGKYCTWDFHMFCETEKKLALLRIELDGLHEAEIKIRAAQRKLARRMLQLAEQN